MQHFKVEQQGFSALRSNYPHSPTDDMQSFQDYLEDMRSQGYELRSFSDHPNGPIFVFTVEAK